MADQIVITEKTSQAKDVRAAIGSRYGDVLPAEGHLFDLLEPEDVVPAWKRWSPILLRPEGASGTPRNRPCPAGADEHSPREYAAGRYRGRSSLALPVGSGIHVPAVAGRSGAKGRCDSRSAPPHPIDNAFARPASVRVIRRACATSPPVKPISCSGEWD